MLLRGRIPLNRRTPLFRQKPRSKKRTTLIDTQEQSPSALNPPLTIGVRRPLVPAPSMVGRRAELSATKTVTTTINAHSTTRSALPPPSVPNTRQVFTTRNIPYMQNRTLRADPFTVRSTVTPLVVRPLRKTALGTLFVCTISAVTMRTTVSEVTMLVHIPTVFTPLPTT